MNPKVLLMPVYSRGNEIERLRGALSLAVTFNAHLNVIYAQSKPSDLIGTELLSVSTSVRQQLVSIMDENASHDQEDLRQNFERLCEENGVSISDQPKGDRPTASWQQIQGARSELVALHGRVSDLVIIPHSLTGNATLTFEEAILHTGRPVMLVPRGMWEFKLNNALIGWDGGLECARATQHALPYLKRAERVTIAAGPEGSDGRSGPQAAASYLACHEIAADVQVFAADASSTGAALLKMASDLDCDLLVTGAYAHTRLRQRILGGVTSHLLKHAELPVLMAH